jgi:hypothetical protein
MQPNKFEDYKASSEYLMELDDWKDYLLHMNDNEPQELHFVGAKYVEESDEEEQDDANPQEHVEVDSVEKSQEAGNTSFGHKLLSKYGWKPGSGLGPSSHGIVKALHFAMNKKRPGQGRIIDRNKKRPGNFGSASRVVRVSGMVTLDEAKDEDVASKFGGQFEQFGKVVRIVIKGTDVYVKFGDYFAAFRAINDMKATYMIQYFDESDFHRSNF